MPKTIQEDTLTGEILHQWQVKEYEQHEREKNWYIFMIVLGLLLILYGIFTGNFLFALIMILSGIIIFMQSRQKPLDVNFAICELGVIVGNRFYPYSELENFYIIYNPPEIQTLFIETKSILRPKLRVQLVDFINPVDLRFSLREYLPEETNKEEEPFGDMIARKWKIH